ncbi:MAG: hypothetical protein GWP91_17615, partial [Rhodobacterales bacterium]|nr:hypothetical protein [Rhodobacterales bacterium]
MAPLQLPTVVEPGALRLPERLRVVTLNTADWATASGALSRAWNGETRSTSAGELAGATALQAAMAGVLAAELARRPSLSDEVPLLGTLDAAMVSNPALPWFAEALGQVEVPDAAFEIASSQRLGALFDVLVAPLLASGTLQEQLSWVFVHWLPFLDGSVRDAALVAWDVLAEESTFRGGGPGPAEVPGLGELVGEPGYSSEQSWMTEAVLAVKHGPVWLAQLTAWTQKPVVRLDDIPESALAALAHQGANVLWLVGIWERSTASQQIKRLRGQREAIASAYSLVEYVVARSLGGQQALERLRRRAAKQGLRLCADVVPNHTGLDSRWVAEHPEWFVQTDRLPFPNYRFTGPNLSGDPRIQVRIEDGYWRSDDAAVVFERFDVQTGEKSYLYHGNDGTTMPWNDTAQLDLTLPAVRRALIDTVLGLTQQFGVLRFDAAMALASKHVRRLWYPDPGTGGAIPSRAGQGLSEADWARRMPNEFWAELVEAVREHAPETLLLAEAFWLMEVDFARSFGLNRVYWSAFRDWVRDDEHGEHRAWLKDVLGREPELLARLCLFLSNPDEESCATAFGLGGRYFAAATLQATFPGLPLLAHGQVDGLPEQYGMEFQRPHLIDGPNPEVHARHQALIAPLLRKRSLFGAAAGFRLFDFLSGPHAQECVYAYSQRNPTDRALMVVNASPEHRRGRIIQAAPTKTAAGMEAPTLVQALGLQTGAGRWVGLRDVHAGLWFLRSVDALAQDGLHIELGPWQTCAFLEVLPLHDVDGRCAKLAARLGQGGVKDLKTVLSQENRALSRAAGVLLHPTSLPSRERVGTLGKGAHQFVDWLAEAGFRCWQVLPLCHAGPGDSPYSSPVSRIGNPLMIDLRMLKQQGWLTSSELKKGQVKRQRRRVRFHKASRLKLPLLRRAAGRLIAAAEHREHGLWQAWRAENPWVEDAVLFTVLKDHHRGLPWWQWPVEQGRPSESERAGLHEQHAEAISAGTVLAWWFDDQWFKLREAATAKGIDLISDLPIYVALDSADVWGAPNLFELDEEGHPTHVSGVPPDAFSADGQMWGNPLYRWSAHAEDGYAWWIERFRRARAWTPVLRIDHFRGFSDYFAI